MFRHFLLASILLSISSDLETKHSQLGNTKKPLIITPKRYSWMVPTKYTFRIEVPVSLVCADGKNPQQTLRNVFDLIHHFSRDITVMHWL
jgi:hypothetical protein